jgi:hypothetical protein
MKCQRVVVLKMTLYLFRNKIMKKIIVAIAAFLMVGSAFACQTQTLVVGGKLQVCTICGSVVSCM